MAPLLEKNKKGINLVWEHKNFSFHEMSIIVQK